MKATLLAVPCLLWTSFLSAADVDYTRDIQPILTNSCVRCHGGGRAKGQLRLDTAAAALKGGSSGPSVIPGKSGDSLLFQSVTGGADIPKMPPKGPGLNQNQIALLKAWIDSGARAPAQEKPAVAAGGNVQNRDGNGEGRERRMNRRDRSRRGHGWQRERERERERERDRNRKEKKEKDEDRSFLPSGRQEK